MPKRCTPLANCRYLGEIGKEIEEALGLELRIKMEFCNTGRGGTQQRCLNLNASTTEMGRRGDEEILGSFLM